jgi:hypothetical protein
VSDRPRVPGDPARNTAATQRTGTISGVQQEPPYSSARNIAEQQRALRTALDSPIELIPYHTECADKSDSPALVHKLARRRECVLGCLLHGSKAAHTTSECAAVARLLKQPASASKRVQTDPWRPTRLVAPAVILKPKTVDIGIQDDPRFHVGSALLPGRSEQVPVITQLSRLRGFATFARGSGVWTYTRREAYEVNGEQWVRAVPVASFDPQQAWPNYQGDYTVVTALAHEPQRTPVIIQELPSDYQPAPGEQVIQARYRTREREVAAGREPVGRYSGDPVLCGIQKYVEQRDGDVNGPQGCAAALLKDLQTNFRGYFGPRPEV